jgi:hypothetical protein
MKSNKIPLNEVNVKLINVQEYIFERHNFSKNFF